MVRGLVWGERGDHGGEDRVGDDKGTGAEHERPLATNSIDNEGDEATRNRVQMSGQEETACGRDTHKKLVIGPTAPYIPCTKRD